jgi:hypothetical protein
MAIMLKPIFLPSPSRADGYAGCTRSIGAGTLYTWGVGTS